MALPPPPPCHCGKGCRIIIVKRKDGARVPSTKCYLDYLHAL